MGLDIIKSLGLTVFSSEDFVPGSNVIAVSELKSKLDKLPVVYCSNPDKANSHLWNHYETKGYDTHKARLLGVEKIVKEPLRVEFELDLTEADLGVANDNLSDEQFKSLTGKKWKVVATEIQEGQ